MGKHNEEVKSQLEAIAEDRSCETEFYRKR